MSDSPDDDDDFISVEVLRDRFETVREKVKSGALIITVKEEDGHPIIHVMEKIANYEMLSGIPERELKDYFYEHVLLPLVTVLGERKEINYALDIRGDHVSSAGTIDVSSRIAQEEVSRALKAVLNLTPPFLASDTEDNRPPPGPGKG